MLKLRLVSSAANWGSKFFDVPRGDFDEALRPGLFEAVFKML